MSNLNFKKGSQDYNLVSAESRKSPLKIINFKPMKNNEIRIFRRLNNNAIKRVKFA